MVWKYRAENYKMTTAVVVPLLVSLCTMVFWIIYIVFDLVLDTDEPDFFQMMAVIVIVAYFVILIGILLYLEYSSVEN